jgi:outer membrane biosynthesis protein TonB
MFDFIKNFFSGIAGFFGGLLGGKKSKGDTSTPPKMKKARGYYMELDETGNVKTADQEKKPEPAKAAVATVEPPKTEPAEAKKPEPAKAQAVPSKEKVKPEPAKAEGVPSKEKVKIEAQPNPPAPAASNGKVDPQSETTFAPNYLISTASKGRRRPGPSMDLFRDMARQVKTPS